MTQTKTRTNSKRLRKITLFTAINAAAAGTLLIGQFLSAAASGPLDGSRRDFAVDIIAPAQLMLDARIDGAISNSAQISQETIEEHRAQNLRIVQKAKDLGVPHDEKALFAAWVSGARDAINFDYGDTQIRAMMASVDRMERDLSGLNAELQAELGAAGMDASLAPEIGYRALISGIRATYSSENDEIAAYADFVNSDAALDACFKDTDCRDAASLAGLRASLKASRITEEAAGFSYNNGILAADADAEEARVDSLRTQAPARGGFLEILHLIDTSYQEDELEEDMPGPM